MRIELQEDVIEKQLDAMSDAELDQYHDMCIHVYDEKRKSLLISLFDNIDKLAESNGFEGTFLAEEYLYMKANGALREGDSSLKPKYRNPYTGETWTGRGKTPIWMQELIDKGASKDDFFIKEN